MHASNHSTQCSHNKVGAVTITHERSSLTLSHRSTLFPLVSFAISLVSLLLSPSRNRLYLHSLSNPPQAPITEGAPKVDGKAGDDWTEGVFLGAGQKGKGPKKGKGSKKKN